MKPVQQSCRGEGLRHDRHDQFKATPASGIRWRTEEPGFSRVQGSRKAGYGRRVSELRDRICGLEGPGAENGRQRADALFHCAYASAARSHDRRDAAETLSGSVFPMLSWKRIGRRRWAQVAAGALAAEYLRLVFKTTRFVIDPPDGYAHIDANSPVILAMWHGQHL